jgi:S1-C subfamily serine protease
VPDAVFRQSDLIRDYVFPLGRFEPDGGGLRFAEFLGSGFLIGDRGFALTASHVVSEVERVGAMFVLPNTEWRALAVLQVERHPIEDVAVIRLEAGPWHSFIQLSGEWTGASSEYLAWSYPDDVLRELVAAGRVVMRPDLVYTQGYVRRRLSSVPLDGIRGREFFELSEAAGPGSSGAPIIRRPLRRGAAWDLIGIYVAERSSRAREGATITVGYAVREDAVRDWRPEMLGQSVLDESRAVFVPNV